VGLNPLLPWFYDHVEPLARRIAERAAPLEPVDAQRTYLVEVSQEIVASGAYRRELPQGATGEELSATLTWFQILDEELEGYVAGDRAAADLIARGGGRLWAAFQAHEPICAIVLGEGSHYSDSTPSPLSLVLSLFDGWSDAPTSASRPRAGFLQPRQWLAALRGAGYSLPYAQTRSDAERQFGGVYIARA
jgi:hypothetical protein